MLYLDLSVLELRSFFYDVKENTGSIHLKELKAHWFSIVRGSFSISKALLLSPLLSTGELKRGEASWKRILEIINNSSSNCISNDIDSRNDELIEKTKASPNDPVQNRKQGKNVDETKNMLARHIRVSQSIQVSSDLEPGHCVVKQCNISTLDSLEIVLRNVDLEILPGSFVLVTGPSGCGKSSLVAALAGVIPPQKGSILWGQCQPGIILNISEFSLSLSLSYSIISISYTFEFTP